MKGRRLDKVFFNELDRAFKNLEQKRINLLNSINFMPNVPLGTDMIAAQTAMAETARISPLFSSIYTVTPNKAWIDYLFFPVGTLTSQITASEAIQKKVDEIFEDNVKPILEKRAKIMFDNGWWFELNIPTDFFDVELKGLEDNITPELLTKKITEYFNKDECKELESVVRRWNLKAFTDNEMIFEDALWAHKESRYTLTVPALTIQVEGVLRSYMNYISHDSIHEYKRELKNRYLESISEGKGLESFIQLQNLEFIDSTLNKFYESFRGSKPNRYDDLYRNLLFHGQFPNYNSIEISTKLFLFLDVLHSILKDLEEYNKNNK